jgi:fatty acid desaturase
MVEDSLLHALRDEVRSRGWDRPPAGRMAVEIAGHVALALGGIVAFVAAPGLLARACALVMTTIGSLGIITFTHTASHYAAVRSRRVNELLTYFGYTFFWGESTTYWWHKHVVAHHPMPNVIGSDPDADLSPWFALTEDEVRASTGWLRFYYERLQCWVFPFTLAGMVFAMQGTGLWFVLSALRDPARRSRRHWIDLGVLLLHWTVWLGLPIFFFPPLSVLGLYALRAMALGYAVVSVAGPGHLPLYAVCIGTDEPSEDFLLRQTATTANFTTGWLGRWLCSGVEYQIEHHLLPNVNHAYYPQVSPLVRELCRQRGVPYHICSWDRALWKTYSVLATPKRLVPDLEAMRQPVPVPE